MSFGEYNGAGSGITKILYHMNGNSNDSSGNSFNGTDNGSPAYTLAGGKFNQGVVLNGSSKYINNTSFATPTAITVSVWFNANSLPTSGNLASLCERYKVGTPSGGFDLRLYNNSGTQQLQISAASSTWNAPGVSDSTYTFTCTTGKWYNLIGTFTSASTGFSKLYLDGVLVATGGSIGGTPTLPDIGAAKGLMIGAWQNSNDTSVSRYFDGNIDEVIIENVTWSDTKIMQYYTYAKGRFGIL